MCISYRKIHLGKDPVSEQTRRQVVEEREIALHEYMVRFISRCQNREAAH